MTTDNRLVTSIFKDRTDLEGGYNSLIERGYKPEDVNFVMSDDTRKKYFHGKDVKTELGNKSAEGLGTGAAIGGTLGGIAAAVAAIGTALVLPGLGIIVAGPLAAGLAGAGAGGIAGGLIGALVGMGIPEERVKQYEGEIAKGGILMGVNTRSDTDSEAIRNDWNRYNSNL